MKYHHSLFLAASLMVLGWGCSSGPSPSPGKETSLGPLHTAPLPSFVKPHHIPPPTPAANPLKQTPQLSAQLVSSDGKTGYIQYFITDKDGGTAPSHAPNSETSSPSKLFKTPFDFHQDIEIHTIKGGPSGGAVQISGWDTKRNKKVEFVSYVTDSSYDNHDVNWSP